MMNAESVPALPSFITVKYGDNQQAVFNPWCLGYVLMESIRRRCACQADETIDLVDLEGQVKNLSGRPEEYAHNYMDDRGIYVLIKVEKAVAEKQPIKYTALLNDVDTLHPELTEKLSELSTSGKLKRQTSRWGLMRGVTKMSGRALLKSRDSKRSKDKT